MNKTFIIAELSGNHNGDIELAKKTILAAKEAGVDAVKIQTYTADTITLDCDTEDFQIHGGLWDGYNYYKLYQEAYTPWEWHKELFEYAEEIDITLFSTPFDNTAVDLLEECGNPIYKIASFEITDVNLIRYAASKGKPMIISTGIATIEDIVLAIEACRSVGNNDITLLKCTSAYPAPLNKANLLTIPDMKERFGVKVGVSDHSLTNTLPITAVALGASVVEKHIILDRSLGGVDSGFSMSADEFKIMVKEIREVEQVIGSVYYPEDAWSLPARKDSRSLYIAEDMKAGDIFTVNNLRSVRPGYGLAPMYLDECLGKRVNRDLKKGERMSLEFVDN
jgi:N-acetylneuraminate synthase/pseudaminic acid synthase